MNKELENQIKILEKKKENELNRIKKSKQEIIEAQNNLKKYEHAMKPLLKLKKEEERFNLKIQQVLNKQEAIKKTHEMTDFPELSEFENK